MKLGIDRADLHAIITWAAAALPARMPVPILAAIRLEAAGGTLTASAFDSDTAATSAAGARTDEPGTVLVPGRLLHQMTASLDGEVAEIEAADAELAIRCDGARFTLAVMPLDEYPSLPAMPAAAGTCDGEAFARAVSRVAVAASHDATLPVLTAVCFEAAGGTLTLSATDRYRLATAVLPWEPASADSAGARALVPASALARLARSLAGSTVTIAFGAAAGTVPSAGASLAGFSDGTRELVTRCITGEFLRWRHLIPAEPATTITADAAKLAAAARQAALAGDQREGKRLITMTISENAVLLSASGDGRTADIEAEADVDGEPLRITFKPELLAEGLTAAGGKVRVGLTAPGKAALITTEQEDDDYQHLVMPVHPQ